ncbi:hypothetical protein Y032_0449g1653 [Ancylostoma ceylanicum]|uniref:Uncharacterized protein n=1 Tax=Ancylostoma ceylanicum TaxID=53326 RepID=A0A016WYP9_9BILA|nr:hypothetical protein Y032_0449g1653 [Ancylostoma ceylanicum]
MRLLLLLCAASFCYARDLVAMGCVRDPSLPFCKAHAARTVRKDNSEVTQKDKEACAELRLEYVKVCAMSGQHKVDEKESEFCQAFENICFRIPKEEPDQVTVPTALMRELKPIDDDSIEIEDRTTTTREPEKKKKKRIDFTKFCKEFKNRYLFVCPDPFRFGQKAVVFCPIYSERCHVPLPDRPVVPTRKPPPGRRSSTVERVCRSYRGFAETYCNNPFTLSQPQYREGCEKYWRFCTRRNGR